MYSNRRKQVLEAMPAYSMTVICSGNAPYKVGDEKYPFSVDRNFYYLTGIDRDNMVLLLVKTPAGTQEALFIERFDELLAKWVGARMLPKEATEISGIYDVNYIEDLNGRVGSLLNYYGCEDFVVYGDFCKQEMNANDTASVKFVNELKKQYPWLTVKNIHKVLTTLRLKKDETEVEQL